MQVNANFCVLALNSVIFVKTDWFELFTEFRDKVEEQFPELIKMFGAVSGMYLSAVPKQYRDKILDNANTNASTVTKVEPITPVTEKPQK